MCEGDQAVVGRAISVEAQFSSCSSGLSREVPNADEVVSRRRERKHPSHAIRPVESRLALQGDGLHPAKYFFDTFALALAHGIALMPSGPRVTRLPTGFWLIIATAASRSAVPVASVTHTSITNPFRLSVTT